MPSVNLEIINVLKNPEIIKVPLKSRSNNAPLKKNRKNQLHLKIQKYCPHKNPEITNTL